MKPVIVIDDKVFKDNTLIEIEKFKYRIKFIKVGDNRYTVELNCISPAKIEVIGEIVNGVIEVNCDLSNATIIKERKSK